MRAQLSFYYPNILDYYYGLIFVSIYNDKSRCMLHHFNLNSNLCICGIHLVLQVYTIIVHKRFIVGVIYWFQGLLLIPNYKGATGT